MTLAMATQTACYALCSCLLSATKAIPSTFSILEFRMKPLGLVGALLECVCFFDKSIHVFDDIYGFSTN